MGFILDSIPLATSAVASPSFPVTSQCSSHTFNLLKPTTRLGFKYYHCPGAWVQYRGIHGVWGQLLGIWSVLLQVIFSFIGVEVPSNFALVLHCSDIYRSQGLRVQRQVRLVFILTNGNSFLQRSKTHTRCYLCLSAHLF